MLQYEVGVIGLETLARAQRSIEASFVQHQRRLNRIAGAAPGARPRSAAAASSAAIREQERVHRAALKQIDKEAQQRRRAEESLQKQRSRSLYQQYQEEQRRQKRLATEQISARRRFTEGAFGKIGGSVRGTVGAVGRLGGAVAGLAGGFAVTGAVQERIRDTKLASQLANQAGNPALKGDLLKQARGIRGLTSEQALGGMSEFVTKTGDLSTARQIIGDLGNLSIATGADLNDLGATAGQAFNVLKDQISDPVERVRELNALMGALAQQGALGAVEIKDLARDFGKLGAATRGFEGGAPDLLRTMGAFAQIAVARGGAESSADASTAASRLVNDIVMHKAKFAGLGVDIKSKIDKTKLRDPTQIMLDLLDKTGGDVMKTSGIFGLESAKIFKGLAATYSEAEKRKKGSGRAAVEEEFGRFSGAKLSQREIASRVNSRMSDPDMRIQETMKSLNGALADKFLPLLMKLIPEFEKMLPYVEQGVKRFAELAEAFAKDPVGGLMKLAAAKLAFDVAASSAAASGKKLAEALSGAASGVQGATGGGAAPGGKLAAGMLGAQLGITVASAIITANVVNFEKGEADMSASGKELNELRSIQERVKSGTMTPEEASAAGVRAREIQMSIDKRAQGAAAPGMAESMLSTGITAAKFAGPAGWAFAGLSKLMGTDSDKQASYVLNANKDVNVKTQQNFGKEAEMLRRSIEGLTATIKAAPIASGASPNRGNAPSPVKG